MQRAARSQIVPRLLSREAAAEYCGLSADAFDKEVNAGTFPGPFPFAKVRRALWDRVALDAVMNRVSRIEIEASNDDFEIRRQAWRKRQDRAQEAR
jgi:predicted DNA-binding transcriptional regulator AlpA